MKISEKKFICDISSIILAVSVLVCTVLLFVVSLVQEKGVVVRNWISERNVLVRYVVLLAGVAAVMILGVYGSGFDEATFIYYQF